MSSIVSPVYTEEILRLREAISKNSPSEELRDRLHEVVDEYYADPKATQKTAGTLYFLQIGIPLFTCIGELFKGDEEQDNQMWNQMWNQLSVDEKWDEWDTFKKLQNDATRDDEKEYKNDLKETLKNIAKNEKLVPSKDLFLVKIGRAHPLKSRIAQYIVHFKIICQSSLSSLNEETVKTVLPANFKTVFFPELKKEKHLKTKKVFSVPIIAKKFKNYYIKARQNTETSYGRQGLTEWRIVTKAFLDLWREKNPKGMTRSWLKSFATQKEYKNVAIITEPLKDSWKVICKDVMVWDVKTPRVKPSIVPMPVTKTA